MTQRFASRLDAMSVTPDLYRGKVAQKPDEAGHLMKGLDFPRAVEDIRCAYEYLASRGAKKVVVVGFCMGGALSLASAEMISELAGVSCFYGIPSSEYYHPERIQCPIQCHFAKKDHAKGFSDEEAALALKAKLANAGKDVSEFYIYPDADHGDLLHSLISSLHE